MDITFNQRAVAVITLLCASELSNLANTCHIYLMGISKGL